MNHAEVEPQGKNGTYAKLVPSERTRKAVKSIIDQINVENPVSEKDLHVTVIYSRCECQSVENIDPELPIVANGVKFDLFTNADGTTSLVLCLDGEELQKLHDTCTEDHGATHDYPTYKPHMTLSYEYNGPKPPNKSLIEYFKDLVFDKYVVEPLTF